MNEVLKYLGAMLRRTYGAVVERPMPWRMIDKLATLEEKEERAESSSRTAPPDTERTDLSQTDLSNPPSRPRTD